MSEASGGHRSPERRTSRPAVATAPIYVSQYTAPALFGFKTERAFLEFVQAHALPRTKAGKTVLVEAEELRAVLRRLAETGGNVSEEPETQGADALGTPDDILARLGLRRAG